MPDRFPGAGVARRVCMGGDGGPGCDGDWEEWRFVHRFSEEFLTTYGLILQFLYFFIDELSLFAFFLLSLSPNM